MRRVLPCNLFGELTSFGKGERVLMRMYRFPDHYDEEHDKVSTADSDRLRRWNFEAFREIIPRHCGPRVNEGFGYWVVGKPHKKVLDLLSELFKTCGGSEAPEGQHWTGYRVSGTVNRSSGYVVWHVELFSRHPETHTKVFSGKSGPNVRRPCGQSHRGTVIIHGPESEA